ncbi:MAG TPA: NAD(P)/FAD-dependent oxidoreductase [Acidimicrobiales bacterium]|jgi:cyclohexanone monooxygenase|nr:NAD(P)/FAD-dependent oxidoreductase [Acidimicrobiales bacterium]
MSARKTDVVVVGAGFAGLYMLHRLRGTGWSAQVYEAGSGVGGTWYWNRYPGARCDVESMEYSYSFDDDLQQEWQWSERYAGQPEILRYLEHVADRYDLRRDIHFDTRVVAATFDDGEDRWTVRTDHGVDHECRYLVMATGCLSSTNMPNIDGLDSFEGEVFHTGRWPHEGVDFARKRVAVIGTGSSGIQSIPIIAAQADHLTVFQRTPNYSVPARNRPLEPDEQRAVKATYGDLRAANRLMPTGFGSRIPAPDPSALQATEDERVTAFETRWERGGFGFLASYADLVLDRSANETAAEFVRAKIRETVADPEVAALLSPTQVIGCKRLCLDTGYFDTFNRPNVRLVDISTTPITAITPRGVCVGPEEVPVDCIVFATGFDAMTGALLSIDIRGRRGATLRESWSAGPRTYLGLSVPDFPNLFIITGPGSPSVLTNMVASIEQHVDWITDCIDHLRAHRLTRIEASAESADQWVTYVNSVADLTLFPTCNSWYLGANVPGKPRVFMPLPGFPPYAEHCAHIAANGYQGFTLS